MSEYRQLPENLPLNADEWERRMKALLVKCDRMEQDAVACHREITLMLKQWIVGNKAVSP